MAHPANAGVEKGASVALSDNTRRHAGLSRNVSSANGRKVGNIDGSITDRLGVDLFRVSN